MLLNLLSPEEMEHLKRERSLDLGVQLNGDRFGVNLYYQKNSPAMCIRTQFAACLARVISQTLIPTTEGKLKLIYEILDGTLPLANIIRSGQEHIVLNEMVNSQHGSTFNDQLDDLCFKMFIIADQAIAYSPDPRSLKVYW